MSLVASYLLRILKSMSLGGVERWRKPYKAKIQFNVNSQGNRNLRNITIYVVELSVGMYVSNYMDV